MSDFVRALDSLGDWTWGKGRANYLSGVNAVAQNIQTRLKMVLGDCFFATNSGIDWFNLLGAKNQLALNIAVSATILNTNSVTGILELSLNLDRTTRGITITYNAQTVYGATGQQIYQYDTASGF